MTRRMPAAVIAAVLAVMTAGCSDSSSNPGLDPGSEASATSPVRTPSVAAVPNGSVNSSLQPTLSSSVPVTTTSSSAAPPISPMPWPSSLGADEVTAAQAAITAYRSYWQMVDLASAQPDRDWMQEVSQYATGPEKQSLLAALSKLTERGYYTVGSTGVSPRVTSVQQGVVVITDCVDKTATDSLDSTGVSVKAPDRVGSYFRHPSTAQIAQLQDGRWAVALTTDDWSQTC